MTVLAAKKRIDDSRHIGTALSDVRLTELDGEGVAEIIRLAAERCVVVFRDQRMTLEEQIAFGAARSTPRPSRLRRQGVSGSAAHPRRVPARAARRAQR